MNDVILNKTATIERCIKRIREEYVGNEKNFTTHFTKQDSVILNLQRACEASIDLATHIVRKKHLGNPQTTRDIFRLLADNHIIDELLCKNLQAMVGFRNIAVHDYTALNLEIIKSLLENRLDDFLTLTHCILKILH